MSWVVPYEALRTAAEQAGLTVVSINYDMQFDELLIECGDRRLLLDGGLLARGEAAWRQVVELELKRLAENKP